MVKYLLLLLVLLAPCTSFAEPAADRNAKVLEFVNDFPRVAPALVPALTQGETSALVAASQLYMEKGQKAKAGYWLELLKQDNVLEHQELLATALYNGDGGEKKPVQAMEMFLQCSNSSISCKQKLFLAILDYDVSVAQTVAEKAKAQNEALVFGLDLAQYADPIALGELQYLIQAHPDVSVSQAYFWGLVAVRFAPNPFVRENLIANNDTIGLNLSSEEREAMQAKALKWEPKPLPKDVLTESIVGASYPLALGIY